MAWQNKPDATDVKQLLAHALRCHQAGNLQEAEAGYRQILQQSPHHAEALHYLGLIAAQVGSFGDAVALMEKALKAAPRNPYLLNDLGEIYKQLERVEESVKSFRQAVKYKPDFSEAVANLGAAFEAQGKLADAIECYERALKLDPLNTVALLNKGRILQLRGAQNQALECYEAALRIDPGMLQARINLGAALLALGRPKDAVSCMQAVLAIQPESAEAYGNMGLALDDLGWLDEAIDALRKASSLQPDQAKAFLNLGSVLLKQGQLAQSIDAFKRALTLKPDYTDAASNLLVALLYLPALDEDARFDALCLLEQRFGSAYKRKHGPFANSRKAEKKLRIGYVSSDFRNHPVARNFEPLIQHRDRSRFEVYLYGNVEKPDETTERFKQAADSWQTILGMPDEEVARKIREDAIDILVLLAGRFDENRPLIAAYRAAPVQVSMHDPATSGLKEMDYLIADAQLAPRNTRERFTEHVVRLPTFYLHAPLAEMPDISPMPAQARGYLTFGSFNNPAKVNDHVVALWSEVLKAVPNSKLLLKYKAAFGVASVKARYLSLFETCGITADKLILVGAMETLSQHLDRYSEIDIALDTFPFTGSTTTFEALWMGVPVITLAGNTMVSRWSTAMLHKIKLDELVAYSANEYIAIAQRLAGDTAHLSELRAGMRERVVRSPLCDAAARTRQIERAYRWMWEKWCTTEANL
ncbi:MAG: tetratricopeptide repeat protein [Burkholderiales bacterium]|nr:tetratricopeptide repeat protein [Burkholderiales bacterium]